MNQAESGGGGDLYFVVCTATLLPSTMMLDGFKKEERKSNL